MCSIWNMASDEYSKRAITPTLTTCAAQYWPVQDHRTLTAYKTHHHCGLSSVCDHRSMMGPSHSLHHIDVQCFIDISCLDGSPHAGRNPVLSKSVTDGCIELFWSNSSDLLCLGVYVCLYWRSQEQKGRMGCRRGRDTMIRSGPLTSLCADKAGHTLTHTQTAIPKHQRLITHLCVIFLWLCFRLQHQTLLISLPEQGSVGLQQGESISKCLQEIKHMLYSDERFCSKTRFSST